MSPESFRIGEGPADPPGRTEQNEDEVLVQAAKRQRWSPTPSPSPQVEFVQDSQEAASLDFQTGCTNSLFHVELPASDTTANPAAELNSACTASAGLAKAVVETPETTANAGTPLSTAIFPAATTAAAFTAAACAPADPVVGAENSRTPLAAVLPSAASGRRQLTLADAFNRLAAPPSEGQKPAKLAKRRRAPAPWGEGEGAFPFHRVQQGQRSPVSPAAMDPFVNMMEKIWHH
ncbi:unnamed protein product [Polarella glacialis]|nr:unnamed protein product [Polarella glacialis]